MPNRRPVRKGSFGDHFDGLVTVFPDRNPVVRPNEPTQRSAKLQEKIDIHALLFERAWQMDQRRG